MNLRARRECGLSSVTAEVSIDVKAISLTCDHQNSTPLVPLDWQSMTSVSILLHVRPHMGANGAVDPLEKWMKN